ncbi:hypothetical protein [Paenibacillus motobuensis]|uniref:Uncharacterized protein n=1 Tax=Paenibacillus motobuensis TaxID=295324 RepID=A0ABN0YTP8_9BACL
MSILICAELGCDVGNAVKAAEFGELVLAATPLQSYRAIQVAPLAQRSSARRIILPPISGADGKVPNIRTECYMKFGFYFFYNESINANMSLCEWVKIIRAL